MAYKMHGRVGDSPIIGAGLYVDNENWRGDCNWSWRRSDSVAGCHLVVELMRQESHRKSM
jgi:N4-(beta-N-acetylglucosaminyl)-L-asparaginase